MRATMLIFSGLLLVASADEEPSVRVAGLQLTWDDPKDEFGGFALFNAMEPVSLGLLVDVGGASVIEMDDDASEVGVMEDGKGTDLKGKIWAFPKISEDGKLARVVIRGEASPADGAETIRAAGTFVFQTGSETEVRTSDVVKVAKGEKVVVGDDLEFKIDSVGKPDWGDEPLQVELEIKRDIPEVAEFRFYDKDGKAIETSPAGSGRMGMLGRVTVTKGFRLKRKVDEFRVEVDVWTDLGELKVPFDVSVGVGG